MDFYSTVYLSDDEELAFYVFYCTFTPISLRETDSFGFFAIWFGFTHGMLGSLHVAKSIQSQLAFVLQSKQTETTSLKCSWVGWFGPECDCTLAHESQSLSLHILQ